MGLHTLWLSLVVLVVLGNSAVFGFHVNNYYNNFTHDSSTTFDLDSASEDNQVPYSPEMIHQRKSKLFPLFTIIRFTNDPCITTSEDIGVCYTRSQCTKNFGIVAGSCAQGLGVCCQFTQTCGGTITQNGTFFRNPEWPTKYRPTGSDFCQVRIAKQPNICQVRINFLAFELDGPSAPGVVTAATPIMTNDAGSCKTDALTITSAGAAIPTICGLNAGQHIYITYGSSDTITMSIILSGNVQRDREWNLQTQMISCRSQLQAPTGCLQYYQRVSGQIQSFNYAGGIHLINQDYSSCVRMQDGMRSIEWTGCNPGSVGISSNNLVPPAPPVAGTLFGGCGNPFDYLIIPGGVTYPLNPAIMNPLLAAGTLGPCLNGNPSAVSCSDRFCDLHFLPSGSFVRSTVRPFLLHFKTDGSEISQIAAPAAGAATESSVGFCLRYQQSPQ